MTHGLQEIANRYRIFSQNSGKIDSSMISVSDLRSGTTFEQNGDIFQVLTYEHIKMGRGSGTVKVKVKNLRSGSRTEKGFTTGARVSDITLIKKMYQYLYKDSSTAFFMDSVTYEQIEIPLSKIAEELVYLKEGMEIPISFYGIEALTIDLPIKMEFIVSETGGTIRGDTQSNVFKDAILENGLKVKVPLFIKTEDKLIIDTRSGAYVERAK